MYNNKTYDLISTNTSTDPITYEGNGLVFFVGGTFDGATVTIESYDGTEWFTETSGTSAFNYPIAFGVSKGMDLRATVSGVGTTSIRISTFSGGVRS